MSWGDLRTELLALLLFENCNLFNFASKFLQVLVSEEPHYRPWVSSARKGALRKEAYLALSEACLGQHRALRSLVS